VGGRRTGGSVERGDSGELAQGRARVRPAEGAAAAPRAGGGDPALLNRGEPSMERPLEIAFHNLPPSAALEAEIRKRVAKLDKLYARLVGCRVSVEALHNQHHTGNVYEVHVVLSVPGRDIAVSREPNK